MGFRKSILHIGYDFQHDVADFTEEKTMVLEQGGAKRIGDGIHAIDLGFLGRAGSIAAYLVAGPTGLALIETGPSTVRQNLEAGIRDAGYNLADVSDVILTHIHLDHAGGVGGLVRAYPHLKVWVHPIGAPHLVDGSRLVNSAT